MQNKLENVGMCKYAVFDVNLIENATQPIQVKKYLDKLTVLGEKILERKEHVYCPLQFRNYFMDMENKS